MIAFLLPLAKTYWKPLAIGAVALIGFMLLRSHYIGVGKQAGRQQAWESVNAASAEEFAAKVAAVEAKEQALAARDQEIADAAVQLDAEDARLKADQAKIATAAVQSARKYSETLGRLALATAQTPEAEVSAAIDAALEEMRRRDATN